MVAAWQGRHCRRQMLIEKGVLSSTSQKVVHLTKMNIEIQKYGCIPMQELGVLPGCPGEWEERGDWKQVDTCRRTCGWCLDNKHQMGGWSGPADGTTVWDR